VYSVEFFQIVKMFSLYIRNFLRNLKTSSHLKEQGIGLSIILKWKIGYGQWELL